MTHDDPKLTAYALDELPDAADRAEVEAFLAHDETARRIVEETRQAAVMLSRGLQSVQPVALTAEQRETIAAASAGRPLSYQPTTLRFRPAWVRWSLAAAACAALAAGGIATLRRPGVRVAHDTRVNLVQKVASSQAAAGGKDAIALHYDSYGAAQSNSGLPNFDESADFSLDQSGAHGKGIKETSQKFYTVPSTGFGNMGGGGGATRLKVVTGGGTATGVTLDGTAPAANPESTLGGYAGRLWSAPTSGTFAKTPAVSFKEAESNAVANQGLVVAAKSAQPTKPQFAGDSIILGGAEQGKQLAGLKPADPTFGPAAEPAGNAKLLDAKKASVSTRFIDDLSTARDALARNDHETARAAVTEARIALNNGIITFTPEEMIQYKIVLQQVESAIPGTESYARINDNPFIAVADQALSTFSIDVDTASYTNVRRFIEGGQLPPPDAVRIEEMINYFPYDYAKPAPDSKEPFKAAVEIAGCPWNSAHRLARVAIKGKEIAHDKRPVSNLVFLIDVSGSMNEPAKLPLVKEGLKLMVKELTENDRIAIVVYAGNAGLVLPSTCADPISREKILAAIDNLSAGGSTNGGQGIELAYRIATENFIKGGTNRVLLATDGDWNVGITDQSSLLNLIQDKAKSGVFLSVLGYGFGNLKDSTMEMLADKGNGHYAYIDGLKESRKVLVEEMSGTLVTIAKDVKIQVEFNPSKVESYRLIGYENRMLRKEDFNNDKVDAGEIGAGHCVTALYELTPTTKSPAPTTKPAATTAQPEVDPLKYQKHELLDSNELMTLKLRYKQPDGDTSTKIEIPATDKGISYAKASNDFKFSAAVAQFGMILRNSPHKGTASLDGVIELADEGKGKDEKGYRTDFVELVKKTKALVK